jgi:DNA-binding PadR family transcriptional regulator
MSPIDLMLIGMLKMESMSAYEVVQRVESMNLKNWVKIGSPTIYQNLKKLAKSGYLSGKIVKEGEMPEKTIYRVTMEGENYFLEMMDHFSSHPGKSYADYMTFISNLHQVDKNTGIRLLKNLRSHFNGMKKDMDTYMKQIDQYPFQGRAIIKYYAMLMTTKMEWIDDLIREYNTMD